jgi:4'-phosphopantetheinyl transferase
MLDAAYLRLRLGESKDDLSLAAIAGYPAPCGSRVKRSIQSLAARQLLNSLLERNHLNSPSTRLAQDSDGHPRLYRDHQPSGIAITISHSRAFVACAITDLGCIGIDVEFCADRPHEDLAAFAFGPEEQHEVARGGSRSFYRIWTMREALAKASPGDIAHVTDGRDYFAAAPNAGRWCSVIDNTPWVFWTGLLSVNYAFAVALVPRSPTPVPETLVFELDQSIFKAS